ncbi:MAG: hypothetical protein KDJ86_09700 [Bauldia sp.]|uniref:hypothetical protein n=1 Tax=Bauldia sp. TaxID=2575872 RepID=UPI001D4526AF|nr:hypothetical protein [Bauldia sp.]MCB1496047.1 hypothetical protein [Bauldia sp.]
MHADDDRKNERDPSPPAGKRPDEEVVPPPPVRPAGPDSMRDPPKEWDEVDEDSDESFPASDPSAKY